MTATLLDQYGRPYLPAPAQRAPQPRFGPSRLSGRPTYAPQLGGLTSALGQAFSYSLMGELKRQIPLIAETVRILAGFVGQPEFVGADDAHTAELNLWRDTVGYGRIGSGLTALVQDHLGQAIYYGSGVGEAEIAPSRDEIARIFSYATPALSYEAAPNGEIAIVQYQAGGRVTLSPVTTFLSVLDAEGSDPRGQGLFMACPTAAQVWTEAMFAHRSTVRRCGIPIFHVNWENSEEFSDPDGSLMDEIVGEMEAKWNEAVRSQAEEGKAKDFYSAGKVTVTTIGADGQEWSIEVTKRQFMEEVIVASGIPPFLFGYAWSTTERMSRVQMDKFTSQVKRLRRTVEPAIRKVTALRQQLRADKRPWDLEWPEVNLQDALEQARAEDACAAARVKEEAWARTLWTNGVFDQLDYAEHVTGERAVRVPMPEPHSVTVQAEQMEAQAEQQQQEQGQEQQGEERGRFLLWDDGTDLKLLADTEAEYGDHFAAACNGRHQ